MPCAAGELCAVQELTPVAQRCAMKGWGGAQVEGFVTPVVMQFKRIVSYSSSDVCAQSVSYTHLTLPTIYSV